MSEVLSELLLILSYSEVFVFFMSDLMCSGSESPKLFDTSESENLIVTNCLCLT